MAKEQGHERSYCLPLARLQPGRQPLSGHSMSEFKSSLLRLLDERGYIHQATDAAGLDALAS